MNPCEASFKFRGLGLKHLLLYFSTVCQSVSLLQGQRSPRPRPPKVTVHLGYRYSSTYCIRFIQIDPIYLPSLFPLSSQSILPTLTTTAVHQSRSSLSLTLWRTRTPTPPWTHGGTLDSAASHSHWNAVTAVHLSHRATAIRIWTSSWVLMVSHSPAPSALTNTRPSATTLPRKPAALTASRVTRDLVCVWASPCHLTPSIPVHLRQQTPPSHRPDRLDPTLVTTTGQAWWEVIMEAVKRWCFEGGTK